MLVILVLLLVTVALATRDVHDFIIWRNLRENVPHIDLHESIKTLSWDLSKVPAKDALQVSTLRKQFAALRENDSGPRAVNNFPIVDAVIWLLEPF